jgi:hypothetical protein
MIAIEADSAAEATTHAAPRTARSTATQPRNDLVTRLSGVFNYEMAISHSHGWETGQNGRMMMRGPETEGLFGTARHIRMPQSQENVVRQTVYCSGVKNQPRRSQRAASRTCCSPIDALFGPVSGAPQTTTNVSQSVAFRPPPRLPGEAQLCFAASLILCDRPTLHGGACRLCGH